MANTRFTQMEIAQEFWLWQRIWSSVRHRHGMAASTSAGYLQPVSFQNASQQHWKLTTCSSRCLRRRSTSRSGGSKLCSCRHHARGCSPCEASGRLYVQTDPSPLLCGRDDASNMPPGAVTVPREWLCITVHRLCTSGPLSRSAEVPPSCSVGPPVASEARSLCACVA